MSSLKSEIGWTALDFNLPGIDDLNYQLSDFADKLGLLVVFSCNHCPYAKASWPLLSELHKKFKDQIHFMAINPNDEQKYPEDSFEEMKKQAPNFGINYPYLRDKEQTVAKAYGAVCTPDLFLFKNQDGQFTLFYRGRINDNWQDPKNIKEESLKQAIELLLEGQQSPEDQPASMGCSIKWK